MLKSLGHSSNADDEATQRSARKNPSHHGEIDEALDEMFILPEKANEKSVLL